MSADRKSKRMTPRETGSIPRNSEWSEFGVGTSFMASGVWLSAMALGASGVDGQNAER